MDEKKTAVLISCSDHYGHRLNVADSSLRALGFDTTYIVSDFDHMKKENFVCDVEDCVQIHAKPYKKNLSFARILSHKDYAKAVFEYLERLPQQPDVIVALVPPNFMCRYAARYKKRHPETRLVFDIFDLWPETFPASKIKKLLAPVFSVWAAIRDKNLSAADFIFTECEMFKERLGLSDDKAKAIYLCGDELSCRKKRVSLADDRLDLCYIGAINNIIDIDRICALICDLAKRKPVALHVIGTGERTEQFCESAKAAGAEVICYGAVYDDAKKQEIISRCHFGLNIMKPSVCIGLTMKSVEYFRHGLPIINNIPADTKRLVLERGVGVQLDDGCVDRLLLMTAEDYLVMRKNVNEVFKKVFCQKVIEKQYDEKLKEIL